MLLAALADTIAREEADDTEPQRSVLDPAGYQPGPSAEYTDTFDAGETRVPARR